MRTITREEWAEKHPDFKTVDDDDQHIETAEIEDPEIRHVVELVERAYDDLNEALHDLRQVSGRASIPARGADGTQPGR